MANLRLILVLSITVLVFLFAPTNAVGPTILGSEDHNWCYWTDSSCNPQTWKVGMCKTGSNQSPIEVNLSTASNVEALTSKERLDHLYGNQQLHFDAFEIENTGHSIQVNFKGQKETPKITDPKTHTHYLIGQLHFHWGKGTGVNGSEHVINSKMYDMELHIVHYSPKYSSFGQALNANAKEDTPSLLVVAILLQASKIKNQNLQPIVNEIQKVKSPGSKAQVTAKLNLAALFPDKLNFFRYFGSLTTPGCDEEVAWIVHEQVIPVSYDQLNVFRSAQDIHKNQLQENFRNPQKRNGRIVTYYTVP